MNYLEAVTTIISIEQEVDNLTWAEAQVLAAIWVMNRLELVGETMGTALMNWPQLRPIG